VGAGRLHAAGPPLGEHACGAASLQRHAYCWVRPPLIFIHQMDAEGLTACVGLVVGPAPAVAGCASPARCQAMENTSPPSDLHTPAASRATMMSSTAAPARARELRQALLACLRTRPAAGPLKRRVIAGAQHIREQALQAFVAAGGRLGQ